MTIPAKPEFSGWFDNVLKYGRQQKEIDARIIKTKELIRTQTAEALAQNRPAPLTDIFSSLLLAEKLFYDDPRARVLVLMSDMLHDYPPYRFDRMVWRGTTTDIGLADLQGDRHGAEPLRPRSPSLASASRVLSLSLDATKD